MYAHTIVLTISNTYICIYMYRKRGKKLSSQCTKRIHVYEMFLLVEVMTVDELDYYFFSFSLFL